MSSTSNAPAQPQLQARGEDSARSQDRIGPVGVAVAICFQIALLVLLNAFPDRIGVYTSLDRPGSFVPILTSEFGQFLPLIDTWLALAMALNFVLLAMRRWVPSTRWADLCLSLFSCFILWQMIQAGPLVAYNPAWSVDGMPLVHVEQYVVPTLATIVDGLLWLFLVLTGLGAFGKLVRLLRGLAQA